MKIQWPPQPLGLDTPFNILMLSSENRTRIYHSLKLGLLFGLVASLLILGVDWLFFSSETVQRLPELGTHPPILSRILIIFAGSFGEELFFRAFVATVAAWLIHVIFSLFMDDAKSLGEWVGILVAAGLAGVWHIGGSDDIIRVLILSGITGITYGWLYWRLGLESAIIAHMVVTASLYIVFPAIF